MISMILGVMTLALAVGCGDDSDNSTPATVACNIQVSGVNNTCFTGGTAAQCTQSATAGMTATAVDSCPTGELLKCEVSAEGRTGTTYFYDQATVDALKLVNATDPCAAFAQ